MSEVTKLPIEMWRAKYHMTKADLARKLGVSVPTITHWETGDSIPSGVNWTRMGEIFECGVDGIFLPFMFDNSGEKCDD